MTGKRPYFDRLLNRPCRPKLIRRPPGAIKPERMLFAPEEIASKLRQRPAAAKSELAFWRILARNVEFNRVHGSREDLAVYAGCHRNTIRPYLRQYALLGLAIYDDDNRRLLINPWLLFRGGKSDHRRACEEWVAIKPTVQLRILQA